MSSQVTADKLGDAVLQSVEYGAFPQDEDVASASVPSTALPKLLEVVGKAREDTKVRANIQAHGQRLTMIVERNPQNFPRSCVRRRRLDRPGAQTAGRHQTLPRDCQRDCPASRRRESQYCTCSGCGKQGQPLAYRDRLQPESCTSGGTAAGHFCSAGLGAGSSCTWTYYTRAGEVGRCRSCFQEPRAIRVHQSSGCAEDEGGPA